MAKRRAPLRSDMLLPFYPATLPASITCAMRPPTHRQDGLVEADESAAPIARCVHPGAARALLIAAVRWAAGSTITNRNSARTAAESRSLIVRHNPRSNARQSAAPGGTWIRMAAGYASCPVRSAIRLQTPWASRRSCAPRDRLSGTSIISITPGSRRPKPPVSPLEGGCRRSRRAKRAVRSPVSAPRERGLPAATATCARVDLFGVGRGMFASTSPGQRVRELFRDLCRFTRSCVTSSAPRAALFPTSDRIYRWS